MVKKGKKSQINNKRGGGGKKKREITQCDWGTTLEQRFSEPPIVCEAKPSNLKGVKWKPKVIAMSSGRKGFGGVSEPKPSMKGPPASGQQKKNITTVRNRKEEKKEGHWQRRPGLTYKLFRRAARNFATPKNWQLGELKTGNLHLCGVGGAWLPVTTNARKETRVSNIGAEPGQKKNKPENRRSSKT